MAVAAGVGLLRALNTSKASEKPAPQKKPWRSATGSFDEVLAEDGASMMVPALPRYSTRSVYFDRSHPGRTRPPDIARRW